MGNTPKNIKSPSSIDIKSPSNIDRYLRIVPGIAFYIKNKNIPAIFKYKCPLFAAGDEDKIIHQKQEGRIYLFSNSLEHMGTFLGHNLEIFSLCTISHKILASGSRDTNIKIWDIEERTIISTLSGHTNTVSALCHLEDGQLVSGSWDNSLIIWSKLPGSSFTYSHKQFIGHKSGILGIIRINNMEIISGEYMGDLRIWNIDEGVCIRHIPPLSDYLWQMKQHHEGEVAISYYKKVLVLGAVNNWEAPIRQFRVCDGCSIEFLDRNILLIGRYGGQLEFVDYAQAFCSLPSPIHGLYSDGINAIQRIAKNILVTAANDGYLKVIDPISRKCFLKFKKCAEWMRAITNFY